MTDEGLNGFDIHLVNEWSQTLHTRLDLVCLRDGSFKVASANCMVELAPHSTQRISAAARLGQFFDFTHAYRFGPRAHDVTIATLCDAASDQIISEAFYLPERRATERHDLGITAAVERNIGDDGWQLVIEAKRFARFVHINDTHYRATRDWFHLSPNRPCIVPLVPRETFVVHASNATRSASFNVDATHAALSGEVRAINAISLTFYG